MSWTTERSSPMSRLNRVDLPTFGRPAPELPRVELPPVRVGLVGHHDHGALRPAEDVGHPVVLVGDADRAVDDEQDHVGVLDGLLRLLRHLAVERALVGREPAAGVDHGELVAGPLGVEQLAVARHAGLLLDDRLAPADDPVHERRLADVGAADDGDDGLGAHAGTGAPTRAARRAWPSVATISTGRGRSAGVVPSRNVPFERHTSGSR
jgi:hypothetical protein